MNSLAFLGVGADDQRHPVRLAARASPRSDPAAGSRCRRWARPQTRRASRADPRRSAVERVDQLGRPSRHHGVRAVVLARRRAARRTGRRTRPPPPASGPCRLAGLSEIACAKSPLAAGTASSVATACAPALSPKIVTLSGSPPNTAMLSRTQLQRHHQIAQEQVVVDGDVACGQRRQVQAAQRAEPVVHRDVDAPLARQGRTVVDRSRRAAHECSRRRG